MEQEDLKIAEENCDSDDQVIQDSQGEDTPPKNSNEGLTGIALIRKKLQDLKSGMFLKDKKEEPSGTKRKSKKKLSATEQMMQNTARMRLKSMARVMPAKKRKKKDEDYKLSQSYSSENESVKVKKKRQKECKEELKDLIDGKTEKRKRKKKKVYPKRPPPTAPEPDSNDEREDTVCLNDMNDLDPEGKPLRVIVVLNNLNLRMDDNSLLKIAIGLCSNIDKHEIIPVFCMLPGLFSKNKKEGK